MPLISIIIPVYNGEKTIRQTIDSVLKQTFSDWELIIINDGSQDSTLDIINSINDSRLQIFSYPNAGQAISRNRGISKASGEYISFIDADDLWTPDKLELQLKALQEHHQAAVAYSWCNHINEKGKFLRAGSRITANGDVYAKLYTANFLENGSNPLIRREALTKIGGFCSDLSPAEDWDLWLRLARDYKFVAVPSPQVLYRVLANSMSSNVVKMEAVSNKIIERYSRELPYYEHHLKRLAYANIYKYLLYKTLEDSQMRKTSLLAGRFLAQAVQNDYSMLSSKTFLKVLLKIGCMALLNPKQATALFAKFPRLSNTGTLLSYVKIAQN